MNRLEILHQPIDTTDVVRLFHRGDCKTGPAATELLRQAVSLVAGRDLPAVLLTGAGFTWAELPGGIRKRFPNDQEFPAIAAAAQQAANDLRRALPLTRPLIVVGVDVFAWPHGSEEGWGVGQFAAILPPDDSPVCLLPKRFPTVREEAYLRVPSQDDQLPAPTYDTLRGRAAVLVCHDLNVYHPRSIAVTTRDARRGWREELAGHMETARPAFGLHLAHEVASERSFLHGYGGWRSTVGAPLFGAAGLLVDVSPDRARDLAASLLTGTNGWGVLDLLERPSE